MAPGDLRPGQCPANGTGPRELLLLGVITVYSSIQVWHAHASKNWPTTDGVVVALFLRECAGMTCGAVEILVRRVEVEECVSLGIQLIQVLPGSLREDEMA